MSFPNLLFSPCSIMQQQKNYLAHSALGTLLVIISLFALSLIPEFDIGGFHFKRINLLSDIIKKEAKTEAKKYVVVKKAKPVFADTCKTGITCIEDYTVDTSGMNDFFTGLNAADKRKVRIAWFGDSYVEGDIMLDPLRDSMQAIFGGYGVGFVPITSEVAAFRETIKHSYSGWKTFSIVGSRDDNHPLGFGGYTCIPTTESRSEYHSARRRRLSQFSSAKIFYGNASNGNLIINKDTIKIKPTRVMSAYAIEGLTNSFELSATDSGKVDLYGVSFESKTGLGIDNFAIRGNSGIGLAYVNESMYKRIDSLNHYDLVVLSYGLNVASEKAKNYDWYVTGMGRVIKMIKRAFPHSSILLIGCSDRAENIDGELQTVPMLKELVEVQRQMAMDNQICFWNLFEAMGGDSTMVKWASMEKHPYANKDYTHLTFSGGKKVADILLGTILYEKEKYDRKKKN